MQSLRFISEAAQDMTAARSLFGRADTEAKAVPAVEADSEADDADFFESASPDTRSEASHYYDCRSEGPSSSSTSQVDPTEEVHTVAQNGGVSPAGKGTSLWDRWQAQVKRSDAAEEALRDLRQQHEHMSAQLFTTNQHNQSLTQHNEELSQWNQRLEQDNAALQADKAALEQRLQQQLVHQEDELYIARWTTQRFYRSLARHMVADEHQQEVRAIRQRYTNLHGVMQSMREQQRKEEDEERERTSSWGYLLRQSGKAAGCVALGACGVLALIHVCEGREGFRALSRQP